MLQEFLEFTLNRTIQFSPCIAILILIANITKLYYFLAFKKFNLFAKYPIWTQVDFQNTQWIRKNLWKFLLISHFPSSVFYNPTSEEVQYRAPIIIFFPILTDWTWCAIIFVSTIFAAQHYSANTHFIDHGQQEKTPRIRKCIRTGQAFIVGLITGYFGVRYQSLLIPVLIHAGINITGMLLPFLIITSSVKKS